MSTALVLMNVLVPLKVMPGWPTESFSPLHLILLCVVGPILVLALFSIIAWTPGLLRQRRAGEVAAGLSDDDDVEPSTPQIQS
ncbi:hypothetical protein [Acidipropionibacterium thoenii]|uniref:hypothetical protein n=1 Tax=Acidipropionibacterium thoenii TaxID=1751 RepID=UPI0012B50D8B|nr:hypothetical protein [Acidipropionibacterium thoenii]